MWKWARNICRVLMQRMSCVISTLGYRTVICLCMWHVLRKSKYPTVRHTSFCLLSCLLHNIESWNVWQSAIIWRQEASLVNNSRINQYRSMMIQAELFIILKSTISSGVVAAKSIVNWLFLEKTSQNLCILGHTSVSRPGHLSLPSLCALCRTEIQQWPIRGEFPV